MFKMIGNFFVILANIFRESMQDNATGKYSSARVIGMLVAIGATAFMWKLVIVGGMSIEYFLAYLAYGTGTSTLNKYLDNRDTARHDQAKSMLPASEPVKTPKPPKD